MPPKRPEPPSADRPRVDPRSLGSLGSLGPAAVSLCAAEESIVVGRVGRLFKLANDQTSNLHHTPPIHCKRQNGKIG